MGTDLTLIDMRSVTSMEKLRLGDVEVARIGLGTNRLTNTPENADLIA
jgi:hypothetical protein